MDKKHIHSNAKVNFPGLSRPSPLEDLIFSLGFLLFTPVLYGKNAMPCLARVLTRPCLSLANFLPSAGVWKQFLRTLTCQHGPYTDQVDIYTHNENTYLTSAPTTPDSTLLLCPTQLIVAVDTNPE